MEVVAFDLDLFLAEAPDWQGRAFYFGQIGSTNQEARARLRTTTLPQSWLFISDRQTAGRGRLNRSWEAPFATGLLCTLTVPLAPLPLDRAYLYTASLALSIQKAVWPLTGLRLNLKWPNDLLRDGRKCGGILAELETSGRQLWLALGFGLNTGLTDRDLAEAGLADKATNLTPPDAPPVSRESLLAATLSHFAAYREQLLANPELIWQAWAEQLITLGQAVQVLDMHGQLQLSGQAVGVDRGGGLLVKEAATGQTHLVQAGDVSVRLADGRYA